MSLNTAISSLRALALNGIGSSSRSFTSSAAVLAGGKGPKRSQVKQAGKKKSRRSGGRRDPNEIPGSYIKGLKLSYSMAAPAPDLSELTPFPSQELSTQLVGTPTVFSKPAIQLFDNFGVPRWIEKEFETGGGPATVIRRATLDIASLMQKEAGSSSKDSRYMLTGDSGSGKSILLLQAASHALASGWIVLYEPKGYSWTDSSAAYAYNPKTQLFHQPSIATSILQSLASTSGSKLRDIEVPGEKSNLLAFINDSLKEERISAVSESFERVMTVLAEQDKHPVLLAIDEVHALFSKSAYRSPQFELLESYHLSTPRLALDYLSARKTFKRGMTLTTYSHTTPFLQINPSFAYALELPTKELITPYSNFEATHLAHASSGFKKIEVPFGMSTKEASGMFKIYAKKGWVRKDNDENFMGAFMASAGNPKELRRELVQDRKAYEQFNPDNIA